MKKNPRTGDFRPREEFREELRITAELWLMLLIIPVLAMAAVLFRFGRMALELLQS